MQAKRSPKPFASSSLVIAVLALTACGAVATAPSDSPQVEASAGATATAAPTDVAPSSSAGADTPEAALDDRVTARVPLGGGPDMPTEAFGSIWVLAVDGPLRDDGTIPAVHRIDPATNEVIASIDLPGRLCQGIGASPEAIWACGPDGLVRIDPVENAIVAAVDLPAALVVSRIAYGAGSVWAFATSGVAADTVVRVDPSTNTITDSIPLGHAAGTMAFGFDALWVTSPTDDTLLRIDPTTNAVEEWSTGIEGAYGTAVDDTSVWVSLFGEKGAETEVDRGDATVVRVDPATGDVTAGVATGGPLGISGGLAARDGSVWLRAGEPFLVRVDPATDEVVDRLDASMGRGDVTIAFDSVWVTSEYGEVLRIDPSP